MNKKTKANFFFDEETTCSLRKSHALIQESVFFWEEKMNDVINEIDAIESQPEWMPDREGRYAELTHEIEFIVCKLQREEKEAEILQDSVNKLLAENLFNKFKKINDKKSED